jgi:20S proteasome alpha/beta subunit
MDPQLGSLAVGVQTSEGIVLGVERRVTSALLIRERSACCD